jgi:hypothetical protein
MAMLLSLMCLAASILIFIDIPFPHLIFLPIPIAGAILGYFALKKEKSFLAKFSFWGNILWIIFIIGFYIFMMSQWDQP